MINVKQKKKKRRLEFYQKWIVVCMVVTIAAVATSFVLAFLGMDTVQELSITMVNQVLTMDMFTILGYAFQNSARAYVADRYGMKRDDEEIGG